MEWPEETALDVLAMVEGQRTPRCKFRNLFLFCST